MKFNKTYPLIFLFLGYCFLGFPKRSLGQRFQSNSFIIEFGNFNMTGGTKSSTNYHLTDTVGQMAPGEYNSGAYTIEAGFQYIYNTFNKFQFQINDPDLAINFGTLIPGIGSTSFHNITISCPAGHGYQVLALQNHPLKILTSGTTIPNTSCNIGSTCTPSLAADWTSSTSYGFGYNMTPDVGTSQFFSSTNQYRPFNTTGEIIMEENKPVSQHSAKVTYKSLISTSQGAGNYENAITFIAVPKY